MKAACSASPETSITDLAPVVQTISQSKGSAILGGEMSALELMKAKQAGEAIEVTALANPVEPRGLAPAASGIRPAMLNCEVTASSVARIDQIAPAVARSPEDFLASKRVRIGKTNFDSDWNRVRSERISRSSRPNLILAQGATLDTVQGVNEWVNRTIKYVEDRDLFGRNDYWAGARKTLKLKKGDCEDIALTKMQLLAAAGFSRDDMYITIARDTIRRNDHALLVVKVDGRYVVLDNATDTLLDGATSHGYSPVLSFAAGKSWLHGY